MKFLTWVFAAICVGTYIVRPIEDPDLWWHIVVGRWIVSHGQVPVSDIWNMFGAGQPWRAYSWSNEAIYAVFERAFGFGGIVFLHFAIAALLALSFFYCFGRIAKDWFAGALLAILATMSCFEHFSLRPQTLTWVCLTWLLYTAELAREGGLTWKRVAALLVIFCVWANTQITAIFGLMVLFLWVLDSGNMRIAVGALVTGLLGTFITPYFGGEWLTFFSKADHPVLFAAVTEFHPATVLHYSTGFLVILLAIVLLLVVRMLFIGLRATAYSRAGLSCILVLAGLAVVKFLPMASIVLSALAASLWPALPAEERGNVGEAVEKLRGIFVRVTGKGFAFLLLCLIFANLYRISEAPVNKTAVPVEAVNFIMEKALPLPVLNAFSEGGYLMYSFANSDGTPRSLVPIDGRTNVMPTAIWKEYMAAMYGEKGWRKYIESVNPGTILWPSQSPFCRLLEADGKWCRVFESGDMRGGFSVYLRPEDRPSGVNCL